MRKVSQNTYICSLKTRNLIFYRNVVLPTFMINLFDQIEHGGGSGKANNGTALPSLSRSVYYHPELTLGFGNCLSFRLFSYGI